MKFKKLITCILAATAMLSIASMGTGCAVKDWFKDKIDEPNSDVTSSEEDPPIVCTAHADVDYNNACDNCGIATTFEEVKIVKGEKAAGNWYRLYTGKNLISNIFQFCSIKFDTDTRSFFFENDEHGDDQLNVISTWYGTFSSIICALDSSLFTFHKNTVSDWEDLVDEGYFYDVYVEPNKTFTVEYLGINAETMEEYTEDVVFTMNESVTVNSFANARRLNVIADDMEETPEPELEVREICDEHVDSNSDYFCDACNYVMDFSTLVSDTKNYTLTKAIAGELAVGNVYRIYQAGYTGDDFPFLGLLEYGNWSYMLFSNDVGFRGIASDAAPVNYQGAMDLIYNYPTEYFVSGEDEYGSYIDYYIPSNLTLTDKFGYTTDFPDGVFSNDVTVTICETVVGGAVYKLAPKT